MWPSSGLLKTTLKKNTHLTFSLDRELSMKLQGKRSGPSREGPLYGEEGRVFRMAFTLIKVANSAPSANTHTQSRSKQHVNNTLYYTEGQERAAFEYWWIKLANPNLDVEEEVSNLIWNSYKHVFFLFYYFIYWKILNILVFSKHCFNFFCFFFLRYFYLYIPNLTQTRCIPFAGCCQILRCRWYLFFSSGRHPIMFTFLSTFSSRWRRQK